MDVVASHVPRRSLCVDYNRFPTGFYWIVSTERGIFEAVFVPRTIAYLSFAIIARITYAAVGEVLAGEAALNGLH
jgi:hypothetical protein